VSEFVGDDRFKFGTSVDRVERPTGEDEMDVVRTESDGECFRCLSV